MLFSRAAVVPAAIASKSSGRRDRPKRSAPLLILASMHCTKLHTWQRWMPFCNSRTLADAPVSFHLAGMAKLDCAAFLLAIMAVLRLDDWMESLEGDVLQTLPVLSLNSGPSTDVVRSHCRRSIPPGYITSVRESLLRISSAVLHLFYKIHPFRYTVLSKATPLL